MFSADFVGFDIQLVRKYSYKVCADFMNNRCPRDVLQCWYAHPKKHDTVKNGVVALCPGYMHFWCASKANQCPLFHAPIHIMYCKTFGPPMWEKAFGKFDPECERKPLQPLKPPTQTKGPRMRNAPVMDVCQKSFMRPCFIETCDRAHINIYTDVDYENMDVTVCPNFIFGVCVNQTCNSYHPENITIQGMIRQLFLRSGINFPTDFYDYNKKTPPLYYFS